jgi:hypothetical protein
MISHHPLYYRTLRNDSGFMPRERLPLRKHNPKEAFECASRLSGTIVTI